MTEAAGERWVTVVEIAAARQRYTARIPGYEAPVAYGVARVDGDELTFGHVNDVGGTHVLPAVVLAFVCGHRSGTATYELDATRFAEAIALLAPAEACEAYDHPNLWSWRALAESAPEGATYVAVFVGDVATPPVDRYEAAFRARLSPPA